LDKLKKLPSLLQCDAADYRPYIEAVALTCFALGHMEFVSLLHDYYVRERLHDAQMARCWLTFENIEYSFNLEEPNQTHDSNQSKPTNSYNKSTSIFFVQIINKIYSLKASLGI
jgi:hypothetical protein